MLTEAKAKLKGKTISPSNSFLHFSLLRSVEVLPFA